MVSVSRTERKLVTQIGRKPTPAELADRLGLPVHKVELLLKSSRNVNSIDENAFQSTGKSLPDKEIKLKDRLVSETFQPSSISDRNSLRSEIRRVMGILSEREAQIVEMRFGLTDGNQMTLEEIGKLFNVTRERIRQIEARALSKMRHPLQTEELKEIFQFDVDSNIQPVQEIYADV
jgi:RNA polymerase primary sigma factor